MWVRVPPLGPPGQVVQLDRTTSFYLVSCRFESYLGRHLLRKPMNTIDRCTKLATLVPGVTVKYTPYSVVFSYRIHDLYSQTFMNTYEVLHEHLDVIRSDNILFDHIRCMKAQCIDKMEKECYIRDAYSAVKAVDYLYPNMCYAHELRFLLSEDELPSNGVRIKGINYHTYNLLISIADLRRLIQ